MSGGGDGFETRVHSEGSQQMAYMVPNRLRAQVELLRDLLRRASLLEETQHLGLTGRQVRGRRARLLVERAGQKPEDADHALAAHQRHGADLQRDAGSVGRDEDPARLGRRGRAEHLAGEELPRPRPILRADNRREVPAADVAEEALGRRVDPLDDPGRVEDVARDGYVGERLLDVAADRQPASRWSHPDSVIDRQWSVTYRGNAKGAVAGTLRVRVELVLR